MNSKTKIIIGVIAVLVLGTAATLQATRGRERGVEVRTEVIERRDLVELVTASGNIRARRTVDVSSDVSAKVAELLIDEGEDVVRGQLLLRLEPDQYQAALSRNEASLAQAEAQQTQQEASLLQAQRDLDRLLNLRARDSVLVSGLQIDDARTRVDIALATLSSSQHGVAQWRASVDEAEDQLSKTIFRAPMDGRITRLNVEEGHASWRLNLAALAANMAPLLDFPTDLPEAAFEGPAFFLHGGASPYVAPETHPRIRALFPGAEIEALEGAGHWLHAEQPEAFLGKVEGWLSGA